MWAVIPGRPESAWLSGRFTMCRQESKDATPKWICSTPKFSSASSVKVCRIGLFRFENMSRNFYILAATLAVFALLSALMALVPSTFQPGLPANGSLWRSVALILLLAGFASGLVGVMRHLFEAVERHSEEE